MIDKLIQFDHHLFIKINSEWVSSILDSTMPIFTDLHKMWWVGSVLAPLLVILYLVRSRWHALLVLLGLCASIAMADIICYRAIKPYFERERPPVALQGQAIVRTERFSGPGFPSNHAANTFAAAVFLSFIFPSRRWLFYLIAFAVAYSRVYVGVHFPLDVSAGALIGIVCGHIGIHIYGALTIIFRKLFPKASSLPHPPAYMD